ncbi:two pore domain potassium channel family protein, partial [Cyanobium sp. HWJ4-Hawea]|uniref:potassium channel family protein n=1 Tax=Cyanobium sp. HWJ4-Hawea TaxID=2823713 RepID=UPI0020CC46E8
PLRGRRMPYWFDRYYRLLGLASFLFQLIWLISPQSLHFLSGLPFLLSLSCFLFWSLKRLLSCLSQETFIGADVIVGAVAGYLLLGLCGGIIFSVMETVVPGSFINVDAAHGSLYLADQSGATSQLAAWSYDYSRIYYFAFVSLTTVGYGDIVPGTTTSQMASVALSVCGPLYLAIVMGLLISRYTVQTEEIAEADRENHKEKPKDS